MDAIEYWKLCDRITIFQAACLIVGRDPENFSSSVITHSPEFEPDGFGAAKTALLVAVRNESIEADSVEELNFDERGEPYGVVPGSIDIDRSFILVESLIRFLRKRNFPTSIFGTSEPARPDYLDTSDKFYAPKLAAAVGAWTAVTTGRQFETKGTPKQWIEKWLREHAAAYELNKADGTLNEDAIQQIAKIVNWKPEGGAGKTSAYSNPSTPKKREK